jgi:predicted transcriptional regulator
MVLRSPISDLERAVMSVIWHHGKATAAGIQQHLAAERPLKDSPIRTVLLRLEEKGYVQHELSGRTFIYSCLEDPAGFAARRKSEIVDRFCHGSLESLLAGMVDDELIDTDELQKIVARLSKERNQRK